MKPEAQRIAIGECCGWKLEHYRNEFDEPKLRYVGPNGDWVSGIWHALPDYLNSLDAMHEAEKVLLEGPLIWINHEDRGEIKRCYEDELKRAATLGGTSAICATAAQRAEAFLRALGKWTEEEAV